MDVVISNYGGVHSDANMKIILGLKRVWMAASDVLLTPGGEWSPSHKSLMEKFDAHRTQLIKSAMLYIYDPKNSDVSAAELRTSEAKDMELRNTLANALQSNTASCEEIMNMDICTVMTILEIYLVESMSIRRYDCCHLDDFVQFLESTGSDLIETATCDLLFKVPIEF